MPNTDETYMRHAIELAKKGEGSVEPNPMVGCVLVRDDKIIGHGYHEQFGGPHAEVNALNCVTVGDVENVENSGSGSTTENAAGATAYVTLEPCSHVGKTGPCCDALIAAEISKVFVACQDPNPLVAGQGIKRLRDAGIEVAVGLLESESRALMAPYLKRVEQNKPWIIAKWAMTLDGKIATGTGDSKWISSTESRGVVHKLRTRVDAIMVGIGTALADDPMLNARPGEHETTPAVAQLEVDSAAQDSAAQDSASHDSASQNSPQDQSSQQRSPALRIVVDSMARISLDSKLVQSAKDIPTLIATSSAADQSKRQQLIELGCEVFEHPSDDRTERLDALLDYLNEQQITNVLVEGGGQLLGSFNDLQQIDEVHCFIGPKIVGGDATTPVHGNGFELIKDSMQIAIQSVQQIGDDVYIVGRKR